VANVDYKNSKEKKNQKEAIVLRYVELIISDGATRDI